MKTKMVYHRPKLKVARQPSRLKWYFNIEKRLLAAAQKEILVDKRGKKHTLTVDEGPFPEPFSFVTDVMTNTSHDHLMGIYQMLAQHRQAKRFLEIKIHSIGFQKDSATLFLLKDGQDISFYLVSHSKQKVRSLDIALKNGAMFFDTRQNKEIGDSTDNVLRMLLGFRVGGAGYWES